MKNLIVCVTLLSFNQGLFEIDFYVISLRRIGDW